MISRNPSLRRAARLNRWTRLMQVSCACFLLGMAHLPAAPVSFQNFDAWWQEYFDAPDKTNPELLKKGADLSAKRRADMIELIENDPKTALQNAFPEEYRNALPLPVIGNVELHVRGLGSLDVSTTKKGTKRTVTIGSQKWRASLYGPRLQLDSRAEIPIHGIVLGGKIAVDGSPLERFPARDSLINVLRQSDGKKTCPICGEPGVIPGAVGDLLMWFDTEAHLEACEKAIVEKELQPDGDPK